ncbi:MAG: dienelactone hydrolase family protein [Pseudomonadota bacterium]
MNLSGAITFICALMLFSTAAIAEQVSFPSSSTYFGKKVNLAGTLRIPAGKTKSPVVILMHGCGGLFGAVRTSLHSHANALHNAGFATLVLDSFTPRGIKQDWVCEKLSRLSAARGFRQRDVVDAISFFDERDDIDTSNVFVMGQSNGGSVAALMTYGKISKHIRAAVSYYPWCGAIPYKPLVPLLAFTGGQDDWTPAKECLAREAGHGNITVIHYSDATHSFDLPIPEIIFKGHKLAGSPAATKDSRSRMVRFLAEQVKR